MRKFINTLFAFIILVLMTANCFAAEFLIKAQNNWMINADKIGWTAEQIAEADKQYHIGDIVQVFPDGKLADFAHAGGKFYVIRILGLEFKTALKYQEEWNEEIIVDGELQLQMKYRRIYRIRYEDLPIAVKNQLKNTYIYNTTWDKVKIYIRNKITNTDE